MLNQLDSSKLSNSQRSVTFHIQTSSSSDVVNDSSERTWQTTRRLHILFDRFRNRTNINMVESVSILELGRKSTNNAISTQKLSELMDNNGNGSSPQRINGMAGSHLWDAKRGKKNPTDCSLPMNGWAMINASCNDDAHARLCAHSTILQWDRR